MAWQDDMRAAAVSGRFTRDPTDSARRAAVDRGLLVRWQRHRDQGAREQLVRRLMPLVHRLARRYQRQDEPVEDLVQVAVVGLVKAIDRFDPDRETAFSSYAVPTMLGELKRHFRDHGWALHVPRGMQERVLAVDAAVRELSPTAGRPPSAGEVATALELSTEEVLEAMEAAGAYEAVSLEAHRFGGGDDDGDSYAESVGLEDGGFELVEYQETLARAMRALPDRDRHVLRMRFVDDLTQAEIAARVGVSQMHVSRLIRRALERVRAVAQPSG